MSDFITEAFVKQYGNTLTHLSQQKGSRLRNLVINETCTGTRCSFDYIGPTTAQDRIGRHGDSPIIHTPHSRRWAALAPKEWGDMIDRPDRVRTLVDPTNPYMQAGMMALGRAQDDVIINAFFGNAITGVEGAGTSAYGTTAWDGSNANDCHYVAHNYTEGGITSATGLTISKLRAAKSILDGREAGVDQTRYFGVTSRQVQDLLQNTEVTSADYNTIRALVAGEVNTFLGFTFVRTERFLTDTNSYRRCPVWTQDAVGLAVGHEIQARVGERADKRFDTYAYASWDMGAARIEDLKVLEVKCEEA